MLEWSGPSSKPPLHERHRPPKGYHYPLAPSGGNGAEVTTSSSTRARQQSLSLSPLHDQHDPKEDYYPLSPSPDSIFQMTKYEEKLLAKLPSLILQVVTDGEKLLEQVNSGELVMSSIEDFAALFQEMVEVAQVQQNVASHLCPDEIWCLNNLQGKEVALRDPSILKNPSRLSDMIRKLLKDTREFLSYL